MSAPRAMRDVFIESLSRRMADDPSIFFVAADFGSPALDAIRKNRPDRFINVGIAEQNLINISTGLALEGFTVFAYAIAVFITMRCYEQTRVNLALLSQLKSLNVNLVGVGAGLSYDVSGPSHHCVEDLAAMRLLPNFEVLSPCDYVMAGELADYALRVRGPKYLRFDSKPLAPVYGNGASFHERGYNELSQGENVCMVSTGFMTHKARKAAEELEREGLRPGIVDLYRLTGYDREGLAQILRRYRHVVTIEEGIIHRGGMDSLIADLILEKGMPLTLHRLGIGGRYNFEIGDREYLHSLNGVGAENILAAVRNLYK